MIRPVMLIVLDGFGLGDGGSTDSTAVAHTPFFTRARGDFPTAQLETSGEAVGLPAGQMGNSEVGHMTMGAGRVIEQDITRIGHALVRGELERNAVIGEAFAVAERGARLHLMGLVSDGGVHSHIDHLIALLEQCRKRGVQPAVHAFLDGRDTPPRSGRGYMEQLLPALERCEGHVATVSGRYYAMDRDQRWERVVRAFDAIVAREGEGAPDALEAIDRAYARDEGDEFVAPTVIEGGAPLRDGDAVLFFNFRADRARELTHAITGAGRTSDSDALAQAARVSPAVFVCMTEYDAEFELPVAFPNATPQRILGQLLAEADRSQLRIAETEKYAHVTFFFNGGQEPPFPGEDRILVPSPRDVATYDHKPEMSASQVTAELLQAIEANEYHFILLNFANPDMLGHTGILDAAVKAVETIDRCLDRVTDAVLARGGELLITADHGNCELMVDPNTGEPHTAHTTNPVPLYWVTKNARGRALRDGTLADLAPTVLDLLELPAPAEMTGRSLLE